MKAIALFALAASLLFAAAAADQCVIESGDVNGERMIVNLTAVSAFDLQVVPMYGLVSSAVVGLSPCQPKNFDATCGAGFAFVEVGRMSACYATAPTSTANGTTNMTTMTFAPTRNQTSFLFAVAPATLTVSYVCNSAYGNTLHFDAGSQSSTGDITLVFATGAACPVPAPPTVAPTPLPNPDDDDDKKKLSTWAIVGIIVGCVVFLVIAVVGFMKCRNHEYGAEGEYSRV